MRYHGVRIGEDRIRKAAGVPYGDMSLLAISRAAEAVGFRSVSIRLTSPELKDAVSGPVIAHVQGQHFVVVEKVGARFVTLADPAFGRYTLSRRDFLDRWQVNGQGILLLLEPASPVSDGIEPSGEDTRDYLPAPVTDWTVWAQFSLDAFVLTAFFQVFRWMLSTTGDWRFLEFPVLGGFVLCLWTMVLILWFRWRRWRSVAVAETLRHFAFDRDLHPEEMSIRGLTEKALSWQTSREAMGMVYAGILDGLRGGFLWLVVMAYLFFLDLRVGTALIGGSLLLIATFLIYRNRLTGRFILHLERRIDSILSFWAWPVPAEGPSGSPVDDEKQEFWSNGGFLFPAAWIWILWMVGLLVLVRTVPGIIPEPGLWAIAGGVGLTSLSLALRGLWFSGFRSFRMPGLTGTFVNREPQALSRQEIRLHRMDQPETGAEAPEDLRIPAGSSVLFLGEDHPGRHLLVRALAGDAPAEKIALTGASGWFTPEDLRSWIRSRFLIRPQMVLPEIMLEEFLSGNGRHEPNDIEAALRMAYLDADVDGWPDGWQTVLGSDPGHEGLAPRLYLAQAILLEPEWLILEDPFHSLPVFREQVVLENLLQSRAGRTTVLFHRRLELSGLTDRIVCLVDGQAVEQGTMHDLLSKEGYYYSLVTSV